MIENEPRNTELVITYGVLACGVAAGITYTWLSLALLTLVALLVGLANRYFTDRCKKSARQALAEQMLALLTITSWVMALLAHPLMEIARTGTISIAWSDFVR